MTHAPLPFRHVSGLRSSRLVLVCDHASKAIPTTLGDLGLSPKELDSHIAWDIGAALVTEGLAAMTGAHAVLAGVSRLVVDCNRPTDHPGWIPEVTCGIPVPGNRDLSGSEVKLREQRWYQTYHEAISQTIRRVRNVSGPPVVLAIHSFTPSLNGHDRPWHVGLLWNRDPRLVAPFVKGLSDDPDLVVGDNQPYSGRGLNHTLDIHAQRFGFAHLSIEIRQDLIATEVMARDWSQRLTRLLESVLADSDIYTPRMY